MSQARAAQIFASIAETTVRRQDMPLEGREAEILANGCNEELMVIYVQGEINYLTIVLH